MKSNLLSVGRYIEYKNPTLEIPVLSTSEVSIKREAFEDIRKNKGIPVRVLETEIGLSKSRYYRWLNYQVDLPLELVIELKKVFNIADMELMEMFGESTDEQLELLSLIIHLSLSKQAQDFQLFLKVEERLFEHLSLQRDSFSYRLIFTYGRIVIKCLDGGDPQKEIRLIEEYFSSVDYLTTFDVLLYLSVLFIKQIFSLVPSTLEKEVILLEKSILRKVLKARNKQTRDIYIGCLLDLACYYFDEGAREKGTALLGKARDIFMEKGVINRYDLALLEVVKSTYCGTWSERVIEEQRRNFKAAIWYLPKCDSAFAEDLLERCETGIAKESY